MIESIPAATKPTASQKGKLLRILGVSFGIAVTLVSTFGVGILRTSGAVAAQLGNFWLIMAIWTIGGAYALFATIAVTELPLLCLKLGVGMSTPVGLLVSTLASPLGGSIGFRSVAPPLQ